MFNETFDFRKFKCCAGQCKAPLPDVYCRWVMIQRRDIPCFIQLLDALGDDTVLSYHILPPRQGKDGQSGFDAAGIFIWVNPGRHQDPELLVKAAANIACGSFTLEQEVEMILSGELDYGDYIKICRQLNCPECSKNYPHTFHRVMSGEQYLTTFAANAGYEI